MTPGLSTTDKHHWGPPAPVAPWLVSRIPAGARVLEIGPGHVPFERADVFVDFNPLDIPQLKGREVVKVDLSCEPLPFGDKEFDFIYCRHVCEDMFNPFLLCAEMSRVGKAGYVETPSPLAELCRGVDGSAPIYRGYHHHRYIIWVAQNELRFVTKYPLVEFLLFDEALLTKKLREGEKYWNTHYLWEGSINAKHRQSPRDYDIPRDYLKLLTDAWHASLISADEFWTNFPPTNVMPNLLPQASAA